MPDLSESIPIKFGLFWSGSKLSFLRFLTFLSIRMHHPNSKIELYVAKKNFSDINWGTESQDFQKKIDGECFLGDLPGIGVNVIESDIFPTYPPNYQSDLFRWWWLSQNGGFYMDTDQIVLKPFDSLPLHADLIFSSYRSKTCGIYSPVGVLGSKKFSPITDYVKNVIMDYYDPSDYNSIGPFMFTKILSEKANEWAKNFTLFNSPPNFFYPIQESIHINGVFTGSGFLSSDSYALHWFGGSKVSQEFNLRFNQKYAIENNDLISNNAVKLIDFWKNNF